MSDRGMKKWAPYKSLVEHTPAIIMMKKNRSKIEKPLISSEVAEEINEILTNYNGEILKVKYYANGEIKEIETTIKKIDKENKNIILENRLKISFSSILYLEKI